MRKLLVCLFFSVVVSCAAGVLDNIVVSCAAGLLDNMMPMSPKRKIFKGLPMNVIMPEWTQYLSL